MSSSDLCGDQLTTGRLSRLALFSPSTHAGGETWWCTAMRCGLACAPALPPAAANAPMPNAAMPPAKEFAPAHARGAAPAAPEQGASRLAHGVLPYFVIVEMPGKP